MVYRGQQLLRTARSLRRPPVPRGYFESLRRRILILRRTNEARALLIYTMGSKNDHKSLHLRLKMTEQCEDVPYKTRETRLKSKHNLKRGALSHSPFTILKHQNPQ